MDEFSLKFYEILNKLDGLNGDCSVYAYLLALFSIEYNKPTKIFSMNKGVHFWVEIDGFHIDCRGIFISIEKISSDFDCFVVKKRVTEVSIDFLKKYILNNKKKFDDLFYSLDMKKYIQL